MQERDGFAQQIEGLRDKVSGLSRQLVESEDASSHAAARTARLEADLKAAAEAHASAEESWAAERAALEGKVAAAEAAAEEAGAAHARAARAWRHERLLLEQVQPRSFAVWCT